MQVWGRLTSPASTIFEVDAKHIVLATLSALARENKIKMDVVQQCVKELAINPRKPNPAIS